MKESKKEFKYALRACRKSKKIPRDCMAKALWNGSLKKFWKNWQNFHLGTTWSPLLSGWKSPGVSISRGVSSSNAIRPVLAGTVPF